MKNELKKPILFSILCFITLGLTNCGSVKNLSEEEKATIASRKNNEIIAAIVGYNNSKRGYSEIAAVVGNVVGGTASVIIGEKMDKHAAEIKNEIPEANVVRVDDGIVITFYENKGIFFGSDKSNINAKSKETLNKLCAIFSKFKNTNILIVGHTDNVGKEGYNMVLSKDRAFAVTNYLRDKGLNALRFTTHWFGETQPIESNKTNSGRAKNRRVNIAIIPNEKMKEEALAVDKSNK